MGIDDIACGINEDHPAENKKKETTGIKDGLVAAILYGLVLLVPLSYSCAVYMGTPDNSNPTSRIKAYHRKQRGLIKKDEKTHSSSDEILLEESYNNKHHLR